MNALSDFGKQVSALFNSMTPSARIMAGLMIGVIVVSLGWILGSESKSTQETLLGRSFTEEQLLRMESALSEAQLSGFTREGHQIKIPAGEKDIYIRALTASNALPQSWGSEMSQALDAGNVFESPAKSAMRHETAKEREVALLIQSISGVEFAAVEYDEKKTTFGRNAERVCSVWLRPPIGQQLDSGILRAISKQVAQSFAGLQESDISVVDMRSKYHYQASSDPNSAAENIYLETQNRYEDKYERNIKNVLGQDYGNVRVLASVELDKTISEDTEEVTYETPVRISETTSRKDTDSSKTPAGGVPGTQPNSTSTAANSAATLSTQGADQKTTSKESDESSKSVAGHTATLRKTAPLVPNKVTVSIAVPESHYKKIWDHQHAEKVAAAEAAGETPPEVDPAQRESDLQLIEQEVENTVRALVESIVVGVRLGEEAKPFVIFTSYVDLPVEPLPGPSIAETAGTWFAESWSTLALLAALAVTLGMMFSWIKSQGESSDRDFAEGFGLRVPEEIGDELELGSDDEDPITGKAAFEVTGAEMKQDLSSIINDNPEAAANLLKAWIGEAA